MCPYRAARDSRVGGFILLLTLVLLSLISVVSVATLRSSALELRMSGNLLQREEALQHALGVAAMISSSAEPFVAMQQAGRDRCSMSHSCAEGLSHRLDALLDGAGPEAQRLHTHFEIHRHGPLPSGASVPRMQEAHVSGSGAASFIRFEVRVRVGDARGGTPRAQVVQGVLLRWLGDPAG